MIKDPAAQETCQRYGAWLPVRPEFAEFKLAYSGRAAHGDPTRPVSRRPGESRAWRSRVGLLSRYGQGGRLVDRQASPPGPCGDKCVLIHRCAGLGHAGVVFDLQERK